MKSNLFFRLQTAIMQLGSFLVSGFVVANILDDWAMGNVQVAFDSVL